MKNSVVIIGAGYGGLALANMLGKAGYSVDVYEKNEAMGGRLAAFKQDGFTFDVGPSWYLMPEVFEQYYGLFGESAATSLDLIRFTPGYKVYFDNQPPVTIHGDANVDARVFDTIEPGAGKTLISYVERSRSIYESATKHFLYNNYNNIFQMVRLDTVRHLPRLLGMSVRPLDAYVSRYFKDRRLRQILEYHMVFLGNSPFEAPAVYALMSHLDFNTGVFYPKRGMMSLVDDMVRLGKRYDIRYHTACEVSRIVVEGGMARGVVLPDGTIHQADYVISNADLHHTETQLLAKAQRSFPERYWQKRQPGPGGLVISLGIKGVLPQLLHHTLYFVDAWKENFKAIYDDKKVPEHASVYICNPNKTDSSLAPPGHENVFILVPLPAGVRLSASETERVAAHIIAEVARVIDQPDLAQRIVAKQLFGPDDFGSRYHAWQYNAFGGESHLLTQSVGLRTRNASRKVRNLFYVGAGTQPGIGLPMCLISAELAFKRICGITKGGPLDAEDLETQVPS